MVSYQLHDKRQTTEGGGWSGKGTAAKGAEGPASLTYTDILTHKEQSYSMRLHTDLSLLTTSQPQTGTGCHCRCQQVGPRGTEVAWAHHYHH